MQQGSRDRHTPAALAMTRIGGVTAEREREIFKKFLGLREKGCILAKSCYNTLRRIHRKKEKTV